MTIRPFSEGNNPIDVRSITYISNSIDTSGIDAFRQGVELTQDKHFQMGIAKIWSGNEGHQINIIDLGQKDDDIFPEQDYYLEVARFEPVLYLSDYYQTQTIVVDAPVNTNENGFDGIIEPLTIRRVVSFTSIDAPFEAHSVKANIESGNYDAFRNSDLVISKVKFGEKSLGVHSYEDNVDMTGQIPTNLGFWPTISTRVKAFDDSQLKDGIIVPEAVSQDMLLAIKGMNPPTENRISQDYYTTDASLYQWNDFQGPKARSTGGFNPAIELPLSGWWRANYITPPMLGQSSLATSSQIPLDSASNDPTSVLLSNGFYSAYFDGVGNRLSTGFALSSLVKDSSWSFVGLVNVQSVATNDSNPYLNDPIISDVGEFWGIHLSQANGGTAIAYQWDGSSKIASSKIPLGSWICIQARFNGTRIQIRIGNGPWVQGDSSGVISTMTGIVQVGRVDTLSVFFAGYILELMVSKTCFTDDVFEKVRGYLNRRYQVWV